MNLRRTVNGFGFSTNRRSAAASRQNAAENNVEDWRRSAEPPLRRGSCSDSAFTLMEVMIACGIFFMATFAILALVSTTLRNARGLQRGDIDAGMAAAQVYQMLKTNKVSQGSMSGDFDDAHRDFSWEANWDIDYDSGATNGLLKVDITVNRRGNRQPVDMLTIRVFNPDAQSGFGPNFR